MQQLRDRREQHYKTVDAIPEIMVMRETDRPRETFFLERGAYDARGEQVQPETPAALPPFPSDAARNRLGLARWLTQPEHPLTARVAVNRCWQLMFGQGLVRTPEDFGRQGQPPTHPELLDQLTVDFLASGWSIADILQNYPGLEEADIYACIAYGAEMSRERFVESDDSDQSK